MQGLVPALPERLQKRWPARRRDSGLRTIGSDPETGRGVRLRHGAGRRARRVRRKRLPGRSSGFRPARRRFPRLWQSPLWQRNGQRGIQRDHGSGPALPQCKGASGTSCAPVGRPRNARRPCECARFLRYQHLCAGSFFSRHACSRIQIASRCASSRPLTCGVRSDRFAIMAGRGDHRDRQIHTLWRRHRAGGP